MRPWPSLKMNDRLTTRRAEAADYAQITRMLTDAGLPLGGLHGPDNFLVICRDARVVGCAAIERYEKFGLLRSVALEPLERGRGFGRRLVEEALRQARRQGLTEVFLLTTTAAPFFERLRFRATRREDVPAPLRASVEFQSACPSSATVMHLVL